MYIRVFLLFLLVFGGLLASPFVTSLGCMVLVSSDPVVTYGNKKIGMRTLFSSGSYSPIVDTRICAIIGNSQLQTCKWSSGHHPPMICFSLVFFLF